MSQQIDYREWQARVAARKLELGITDADDDMFRNSGLRRTPEKRQALRELADRCRAAGVEPLKANY